jgi:putative DNA primase/helicase
MAVMAVNNGLDFVIISEGPSDGLTAYGAGYTALVLRGAALGRDEETLDTIAERLHGSIVMVAGDNDPAGDTFRENLLTELTARGMDARPLLVPEDYGDLTEWRESDPDAFPRALEAAIRASSGRNAIPTPVGPWQDFIAAHGYPDTIVAPGATNATAAEAVLWTMRHQGENVIYIRGYGLVPYCEGKWWPAHEHKLRTIMHRLGRQARAFTLPPLPTGPDPQQEAIRGLGMKLGQRYFLDATTKELGAMVDEHRADDLDAIPYYLLVGNGVVDLRTGDLRDPRPDMLLSNRLDFDYDPSAECPRWEAFLSEVMKGDADMVGFLSRLIGYGITGETKEQCFGILHGRGANGKTVLIETLSYVFGPITKTVPFSVFEDGAKGNGPSPELARLRGARLTMTSEGDQGKPMKESLVKSMTGSDTITARHLYQEEVEFHPRHLILMATNHKPVFHGVDEGLWRRVKLIPFSRYFAPDERDHYLLDTLKSEAPGILRWAVEGAVAWYAHGLQDPDPVQAATESYRENSDILAGFYPGVLVEAPGTDTKLSTIHAAFEEWADEEGINEYSSRWLSGALEERGLTKARRRSGMIMLGCRLTTEAERVGLYDD